MSKNLTRLPVRCIAHTACKGAIGKGVECANRSVECREFSSGLVLVREPSRGIMDCDWHRPCSACLLDGAVKDGNEFGKGFMTCCTRQWRGGRWQCKECGARAIGENHARLYQDPKSRRQIRQHLRKDAGLGVSVSKFVGFWCGPLVPDEDYPGYWERFGGSRAVE